MMICFLANHDFFVKSNNINISFFFLILTDHKNAQSKKHSILQILTVVTVVKWYKVWKVLFTQLLKDYSTEVKLNNSIYTSLANDIILQLI